MMSKTRLRRDTPRESYDFLKVPNHEREIQIFTKLENQPIFEFFKIRIKDKTMEILMVKSDFESDVALESYDFLKVPNQEREIQIFHESCRKNSEVHENCRETHTHP